MGEAIKALLEDNSGDYYFVGQECVLGMEKDEDMRMMVCGVLRGLLDCGFEDMLIDMCNGSKAFNQIFEEGKKVIDKQE